MTEITSSIERAAFLLRSAKVVAFPTETVYGIGALFNSEKAVQEIYQLKNRPSDNPLIVHIAKKSDFFRLTEESAYSAHSYIKVLVEKFFPGALTLVLPKRADFPWSSKIFPQKTIALRMPSLKSTQELIKRVDSPLVAASANLSGKPSATSWQHVRDDLSPRIRCILRIDPSLESLESLAGLESTILDCCSARPRLLRAGSLTIEELNLTLKSYSPELKVETEHYFVSQNKKNEESQILSPGLKYKHYAPLAKVKIFRSNKLDRQNPWQDFSKRAAFIGFKESLEYLESNGFLFKKSKVVDSLEEYARVLFDFFRESDLLGIEVIFCQAPSQTNLGLAIYERLSKAAA